MKPITLYFHAAFENHLDKNINIIMENGKTEQVQLEKCTTDHFST